MQEIIETLVQDIREYENVYGEDQVCLVAKAKLFDMIGEYGNSLKFLRKALTFNPYDTEVLYSLGAVLEKTGDLALAYVYYARTARELREQNRQEEYQQLLQEFENIPPACKDIFDTVLHAKQSTYIIFGINTWGKIRQRPQHLTAALHELGNQVIYVTPSMFVTCEETITSDDLADYVLEHATVKDDIRVLTPLEDTKKGIASLSMLVQKLVKKYPDAVLLVMDPWAYDSVKPYKGKNKIIFDCIDDNSDTTYAYWSTNTTIRKEKCLVDLADEITCTAASLFLRKAVIENRDNVHLSQNAVSATQLQYGSVPEEPRDLKYIPHPRVGYVGYVYQRFDSDLFYQLAEDNPDKSFVVVGSIKDDNYLMRKHPNIYLLGIKKHSELSAYYKYLDIGIIPYFDHAKMSMACDPVKLHEHIASNLPTITTYMPDTAVDRPLVYHGNTVQEFQKYIDEILEKPPTLDKKELDLYLVRHSWVERACHMMRITDNALLEYETKQETIAAIRKNFEGIKDLHSNFRIIHAMTLWNSDPETCRKEINAACQENAGDFQLELRQLFDERKIFLTPSGESVPARHVGIIDRRDCSGCSSCVNICPVNACQMKTDGLGFCYPEIDDKKCVNCGMCVKHCPVKALVPAGQNTEECYAVMASNNIRLKSSSGGMFTLLADKILQKGGYVCGAVFDENFEVRHILSDQDADVQRMCGSKYVQSDMSDVYRQTGDLLGKGIPVFFTGCPCQVAGLYSYLGKNPEGLLTMSFLCAGVPSPVMYRQHLESLTEGRGKITDVSFRDKTCFGWGVGLSVRSDDGYAYTGNTSSDIYMQSFLSGTAVRDSCFSCRYKGDVHSDITVGDFWGIQRILQFEDGLGSSYVSVNSQKGIDAMRECFLDFNKMAKLQKSHASLFHSRIKNTLNRPPYRDRFTENYLQTKDFEQAYEQTFLNMRFDAALILWWSPNYGNALTNYALYQTLLSMGLNVLAVDNLRMSPYGRFRHFAEKYMQLSSLYFPAGSEKCIISCSDNFIVGSDQVWNLNMTALLNDNGYFQLRFVPDDKNKISYGSSFGRIASAVNEKNPDYYKALYQRMDAVSLREQFGVEIMEEIYEKEASYVLDPVLLLTKQEYLELASAAEAEEKDPYIVSYILNPSAEKIAYLAKLQERLGGIKVIFITDGGATGNLSDAEQVSAMDLKTAISPEEWLYYFANSEFVVTDSYHGTWFSMLFEKRFLSFVNRQGDRFATFGEFEDISWRIRSTIPETVSDVVLADIDYTCTKEKLAAMKEKSLDYLRKALKL